MTVVSVEEAQARLLELIERMAAGEQITLSHREKPIAVLSKNSMPQQQKKDGFGCCKGQLEILVEDDDHLADFKEYMS